MKTLRFHWDPRKASANLRKHGVAFEEARTVFYDENALLRLDEDHSEDEGRFVLLVCHCYRQADEVIRVISARRADVLERQEYARRRLK